MHTEIKFYRLLLNPFANLFYTVIQVFQIQSKRASPEHSKPLIPKLLVL